MILLRQKEFKEPILTHTGEKFYPIFRKDTVGNSYWAGNIHIGKNGEKIYRNDLKAYDLAARYTPAGKGHPGSEGLTRLVPKNAKKIEKRKAQKALQEISTMDVWKDKAGSMEKLLQQNITKKLTPAERLAKYKELGIKIIKKKV